jgi:ribosomal protein S18 acetylase RimI-like enzyme
VSITVRSAGEADLGSILALYGELHPADEQLPWAVARDVWQQILNQPGRTILVAEQGSSVAGTVDCAVLPNLTRNARAFMLIENVVVAEAMRRQGIATALLDAAVHLARSAGCYKIQLLSRMSREAAHALYESRGFQVLAQGYRLYLD